MQLSVEAGTLKAPGRLREVRGRELRQGGARRRRSRSEPSNHADRCAPLRRLLIAAAAGRRDGGGRRPPRRASRPACSSRRAGARLRAARLRRHRADAGPLPRQGRAAVVRLHPLRGRLPDHAGDAGAGAQRAGRGGRRGAGGLRDRRSGARRRRRSMRAYLAAFDPSFVGGTGRPEVLAAVRKSYGVVADKVPMGRRLRRRPHLVDLPDRPRRQAARDDALRPRRRGLRARRQAAAGEVTDGDARRRGPGEVARVRDAGDLAAGAARPGCAGLGCAGADRAGFARRAVRDPARHLGAPHGGRQGRDPAATRSA